MSKFVIQIPHENVWTTEVCSGFLRILRFKNASMRAKKHVNFTFYQMGRHAVRYVATNVSAKLLPPSSKGSYALTEQIIYHHNT
jgi:hypothetical protein